MPRASRQKINGADLAAVPPPSEDSIQALVADGVENIIANRAQRKREKKALAIAAASVPPGERPTTQVVVPPDLTAKYHASATAVQLAESEFRAASANFQASQIARQNELVNIADQMGLRPSEVVKFDPQQNGTIVLIAYAKA